MAIDVHARQRTEADLQRLRDAEPSFSAETLTSRFLTGTVRLPEAYLGSLRQPESRGVSRLAQVALADGELVGGAECVGPIDSPRPADLSVLVADAWQAPWRRPAARERPSPALCRGRDHAPRSGGGRANAGCLTLSRAIGEANGWSIRS